MPDYFSVGYLELQCLDLLANVHKLSYIFHNKGIAVKRIEGKYFSITKNSQSIYFVCFYIEYNLYLRYINDVIYDPCDNYLQLTDGKGTFILTVPFVVDVVSISRFKGSH